MSHPILARRLSFACKVRIRRCRDGPSVSNGAIELESKHWLVPCEATRQQSFWPEKHFKWTEVCGQPIQPFRLIENGHFQSLWSSERRLKICLQKSKDGWRKYCLSVSKSIYLLLTETNEKENAVYATSINSVSPHGIYTLLLIFVNVLRIYHIFLTQK